VAEAVEEGIGAEAAVVEGAAATAAAVAVDAAVGVEVPAEVAAEAADTRFPVCSLLLDQVFAFKLSQIGREREALMCLLV
jgi:hypothetical protein